MKSKEVDKIMSYWTPIFNIFNPGMPLVGPVLEKCYIERENSTVPHLTLSLQPDRLAQKSILAGMRGAGKTSALVRLAHSLSKDYLVVWIDLSASLDFISFTILDLLLATGGGVYKVARLAGLDPNPQPWAEVINALGTLIAQLLMKPDYHIDAEEFLTVIVCARADPNDPLNFIPTDIQTTRFSLNLDQVKLAPLQIGPVLREMVGRVNLIIDDVQRRAGRDLLVIVDGMDKLDFVSAQKILEYSSALLDLRCRMVYTMNYAFYKPGSFASRDNFDIYDLPNIKLHARRDRQARYEPGFETLRQVARKRLEAVGLELEALITQDDLDRLIWGSGGMMRDFIRLVKISALEAELKGRVRIEKEHVEYALATDQQERSTRLSPDALDYLRGFKATGDRQNENRFFNQISEKNIVAYSDLGKIWYDVHSNVLPLLEEENETLD